VTGWSGPVVRRAAPPKPQRCMAIADHELTTRDVTASYVRLVIKFATHLLRGAELIRTGSVTRSCSPAIRRMSTTCRSIRATPGSPRQASCRAWAASKSSGDLTTSAPGSRRQRRRPWCAPRREHGVGEVALRGGRGDALSGLDQPVVDEQLLRLADVVEPGHVVVFYPFLTVLRRSGSAVLRLCGMMGS
jgi:hypothetical protein